MICGFQLPSTEKLITASSAISGANRNSQNGTWHPEAPGATKLHCTSHNVSSRMCQLSAQLENPEFRYCAETKITYGVNIHLKVQLTATPKKVKNLTGDTK